MVVKRGHYTRFASYGITRKLEVHNPPPHNTGHQHSHGLMASEAGQAEAVLTARGVGRP